MIDAARIANSRQQRDTCFALSLCVSSARVIKTAMMDGGSERGCKSE